MKRMFLNMGIMAISIILVMTLMTSSMGDRNYITPAWQGNTDDLYQFSNMYYYISNYENDSIYINLLPNTVFSITNITVYGNVSIYLQNTTYNYNWYIYPSIYQNTTLPISTTNITFNGGSLTVYSSNNTVIFYNQNNYTSNILYDRFVISGQGQVVFSSWSMSISSTPLHKDFTLLIFGLILLIIGFILIYAIDRMNRW